MKAGEFGEPDTGSAAALRCHLQFAAILLQLTKVPSLFPFLVLYVTLQRGSGAVCITVVEGGCEVGERWMMKGRRVWST